MEPNGEKAEKEESSRSGARSAGRIGLQRSQEASEQRKWTQGRSGQEPQENVGRETQCAPAEARSPQRVNLLIEAIRGRLVPVPLAEATTAFIFLEADGGGTKAKPGTRISSNSLLDK
jgi:hypothetical protein